MFKSQSQQVSEGGMAIQASGNVSLGLTYSEVRQVAIDVFKSNFYELSGIARDTANARAEQVTEDFLAKLQRENPSGIGKANDPSFQHALFTVQQEYAKTGDKDLGDLLVDLLVDRSKEDTRTILQIVLSEALSTAPKLTEDQLAALSLIFLFTRTAFTELGAHAALGNFFDKYVAPFASKLRKNASGHEHLEFCGCGKIGLTSKSLGSLLGNNAQGHFQRGFEFREVSDRGITIANEQFFAVCLNDPELIQVRAVNKERLVAAFDLHNVPPDDRPKMLQLFDHTKMNDEQVRAKCVEIRPFMSEVFDVWDDSAMSHISLTSVGLAIGHGNIKRISGPFSDLSIWVN